jgi:hypothetical protein
MIMESIKIQVLTRRGSPSANALCAAMPPSWLPIVSAF